MSGSTSVNVTATDLRPIEDFARIAGDGITDDSAAFQAAHDAAFAAGLREVRCDRTYFIPTARDIGNVFYRGQGRITGNLWARVVPFASPPAEVFWGSDVLPGRHLIALTAAASPIVVLVGDSRSSTIGNPVTPMDNLWGLVQREFRRQNPHKTFTFLNRAITGTTAFNFNSTSLVDPNPTGHPGWAWDPAKSWRQQVQDIQADVVVYAFGMNGLIEPVDMIGGLAFVCAGAKVPDVVLVTTPSAFTRTGNSGNNDRIRNAGVMRSLAVAANPGAVVANMRAPGLIDVGRAFWRMRYGYDLSLQIPERVQTSVSGITSFPYTLPRGDGDIDVQFSVPAAAATSPGINISLDDLTRGLVNIDNGAGGACRMRFLFQNGGGTLTSTGGSTPTFSTSGLWTFRVTLKGNWCRGTYSPDGGTTETVIFNAPAFRYVDYPFAATITTGRPSMSIDWCNVGRAELCAQTMTEAELWGLGASGPNAVDTRGGNAQNHETSTAINRMMGRVFSWTNLAA